MLDRIKVIWRKLGREQALGTVERKRPASDSVHRITIDPRQKEKEMLDTMVHELLHIIVPKWEEAQIARVSRAVAANLWRQGYRRVRLR